MVLGCAGMVGWEGMVGRVVGKRDSGVGVVVVVDPVKAGVEYLQGCLGGGR